MNVFFKKYKKTTLIFSVISITTSTSSIVSADIIYKFRHPFNQDISGWDLSSIKYEEWQPEPINYITDDFSSLEDSNNPFIQ